MKERLEEIKIKSLEAIKTAKEESGVEELRVKLLGKKGELTLLLKEMGKLSKEERPVVGKIANEIRKEIEKEIEEKKESFKWEKLRKSLIDERIDVTASKDEVKLGHRHPLNQTMEELENLFRYMGFSVIDGPEIETVENNFDKLNSPKNHPSRDLSDTFYIDKETLLRTHTSPVQVRTMLSQKPPIRMVSAGRTFRFDEVDSTHSPMFHQIEGLVVGENVSMANLIDTINVFIKELFGEEFETRFRPHYFPFTEPSMEVDVSCFNCKGKGCEACHNTGWSMELLGCGMVHPQVLENCGIDSKKYTGFAFGMGVDRITMVKYGLDDIRLIYENDKRFLEQF